MSLTIAPSLQQSQQLRLTPGMLQSIKLMGMRAQELDAYVGERVEENPFLERRAERGLASFQQASPRTIDPLLNLAQEESLATQLLNQVAIAFRGASDRALAVFLVSQLDDAGYLPKEIAESAEAQGYSQAHFESVLARLQRFEPSGLFARSLAECLALQLRDRGALDAGFEAILENLPLALQGIDALAEAVDLDADEVAERMAELRCLDPKPGLKRAQDVLPPRIPDLLVARTPGGYFDLSLNPEAFPRIDLDRETLNRLRGALRSEEERRYAQRMRHEAAWLIRALSRRAATLLTVGSAVVQHQQSFFERGMAALRPLTRRQIAAQLQLSEATISRIVANKTLATPQGQLDMSALFSTALGEDASNSATAVRERIRIIIAAESPTKPVSDETICRRLKADGIQLARRTVAKYRDALNIPGAAARKRGAERPTGAASAA